MFYNVFVPNLLSSSFVDIMNVSPGADVLINYTDVLINYTN